MGALPIGLSARVPTQPESYLDMQTKAVQLSALRQAGQMNALKIQEAQQQLADQQAQTAAMHEWDGKNLEDLPGLVLKHGGSAQTVMGMRTAILKQKQDYASLGLDQQKLEAAKTDKLLGALNSVLEAPDEEIHGQLQRVLQDQVQAGTLDAQHAQAAAQLLQQDPAALRKSLGLFEKSLSGLKAQQEQAANQATVESAHARTVSAEKPTEATLAVAAAAGDEQAKAALDLMRKAKSDPVLQQQMDDWLKKHPGKGPADFMAYSKTLVPSFNLNVAPERAAATAGAQQAVKDKGMARDADFRLGSMQESADRAKRGDQQAMLNVLANHIGMTLGLQKGARITRAVWEEAMQSAPMYQRIGAKFDNRGYLSGVVLTPQQIDQMMDLARTQRNLAWRRANESAQDAGLPVRGGEENVAPVQTNAPRKNPFR